MKYLYVLTLCLLSFPVVAADNAQPFASWLSEFKRDAVQQGIARETLDDAFANTQPIEKVIKLDQKQPESHLTLDQYLDNTVTEKRITEGGAFYVEHRTLLDKVSAQYGVQPKFILALWGMETNFGKNTGGFSTIDALATLAYDGRRSDFFREELLNALKILQAEHMPAEEMKGSWAGALGQCQFMPSSFLKFAVDYNGDGKRDIWNTQEDVFASIANYLSQSGWSGSEGWGKPVSLTPGFDVSLADIKRERSVQELQRLGVRNEDGGPLTATNANATLIMVGEGSDAVPFIVYGNYKVLLKWNRSRFFATAVSMLADDIAK